MLWCKSTQCPCMDVTTLSADPQCPYCHGIGFTWETGIKTIVGLAGEKAQMKWLNSGLYEEGDLVCTIPEISVMWDDFGPYDRLIALNATHSFSRVFIKGHPTERLNVPVESIKSVYWRNAAGDVVNGVIPKVSSNGEITFPDEGKVPPYQTKYVMKGLTYSDYFIFRDIGANRNEHSGMRLPKKLVLRRFNLLRKGVPIGGI